MRLPFLAALFSATLAACAAHHPTPQNLDRAIFRRQDSSFVNQAIDELVRSHSSFFSLIALGIKPREIIVTRGDSAALYQALGVYITYKRNKPADVCNPPSWAALMGWRELAARTGIEAVSVMALGDSAGMRDTFSVKSIGCQGPITMHHPGMAIAPIIGRQWRPGLSTTGRGTLQINLGSAGARPCPEVAERFLASQSAIAECRETWMQVFVQTTLRARDPLSRPDSVSISAAVPALHIWIECRGPRPAPYFCPPEQPPRDTMTQIESYTRPKPPQLVTFSGFIRDAEEGVPIPYARGRFGRAVIYADSNGRFSAALTPGRVEDVWAECHGKDGSSGVRQDPVQVRPYMADVVLFLPRRNCVRPPDPVQDSVFEGTYDGGVERSEFRFCGNRLLNVWADFTERADADRTRLLTALRGKETSFFNGFVWKVRGSLAGPGRFGMQSTSDYLLTVHEVLEIRVRGPSECMR